MQLWPRYVLKIKKLAAFFIPKAIWKKLKFTFRVNNPTFKLKPRQTRNVFLFFSLHKKIKKLYESRKAIVTPHVSEIKLFF